MKNIGNLLILVCLAVVIVPKLKDGIDLNNLLPKFNTTVEVVDEPSDEIKALVAPLTPIVKKGKPEHAALLANFFRDFGEVVIGDPLMPTNADVKLACENAGKRLLTKYKLGGTYEGFSETVYGKDGIIIKYLGNNPKAIDAVKAKALFNGLQWACLEATK